MSFITKDKSGAWRARYRDPDGRSKSKNFARKVDAEQFLTSVDHSKLSGAYVDPSAGKITLGAYATQWAAMQVWRPSTVIRIEGQLVHHISPMLGSRPIGSVRPSDVQGFIKGLTLTLAPGTVRGIYTTLAAIYRAAVRDRVVPSSPCIGIKLPSVDTRQIVPLTLKQVEAIADTIGDRYRPLVTLGAGAGLRIGEALGLGVDGVDFLRRTIAVTRQVVTVRTVTSLAPPKTAASIRVVPMAATVAEDLASWLANNPRERGELLVVDDQGAPIPQNRFSQTWARAVAQIGLPKGTRYHDLRHTFASALISAGCSVKAVQVALGHESAAVTLDTYSHLWPSDEDKTRAAIDAFLSPNRPRASDSRQTKGSRSLTPQV